MNPYTAYYAKQAQTGIGSSYYPHQAGRGVGNFLSNIFRSVMPYLKSGLSAIKDELFNGGVGILSDTIKQVPIKQSLQNRVRTMGTNLTDRAVSQIGSMSGSGLVYKRKRTSKPQSTNKTKKRKTCKKKTVKKAKKQQTKKKTVKRLQQKKRKVSTKKNCKSKSNCIDIFS